VNKEVIGNRYKFIQPLGEGGFGKTFIAEDLQRPGRPRCVIKYLKHCDDKFALRLFEQEAAILEKLGNHDQIPRLLAYFEEDGEFYLIQQLIEGNPLSLELNLGHPWTEERVLEMLIDCLQVVDFVHSYNVIHRDIKPDNIIRRSDNRLVLVDFGTVKGVETGPVNLTVGIYSHGYTPNEQMSGRPRKCSDIFALGMICIQAITGIDPTMFDVDADGELIWEHHVPNINPKLAALLSKMVKSHHTQRYQSVDAVALDISELIASYSLTAISISPRQLEATQIISTPNSSQPQSLTAIYNEAGVEVTQGISTPNLNQPKSIDATQVISTPDLNQPKAIEATQIISIPDLNQPKTIEATQVISIPDLNQPSAAEANKVISTPNLNQPSVVEANKVISKLEKIQTPPTRQPSNFSLANIKILAGIVVVVVIVLGGLLIMNTIKPQPNIPPTPATPTPLPTPTPESPNGDLCPGPLCPN